MYTKTEKILVILFVVIAIGIAIYYNQNADWENICNSWLRFSKPNLVTCLLKGY